MQDSPRPRRCAKSTPVEHGLPFSTWSLTKLAEFLVAEGVVDDISHEGLRVLLREEGVSFQKVKTWKQSKDPEYRPGAAADDPHQASALVVVDLPHSYSFSYPTSVSHRIEAKVH